MNGFIHLEGELLQIKGATKVTSSTPTQAMIELGGNAIVATGNGIEVKKLNLDEGEVVLSGKFSNMKLSEASGAKGSLLKRIFK